MTKDNDFTLVPLPRCFGFLEGNLDLGFFTTLGLLLPSRGGIVCSAISRINQLKKGVTPKAVPAETERRLDEPPVGFR